MYRKLATGICVIVAGAIGPSAHAQTGQADAEPRPPTRSYQGCPRFRLRYGDPLLLEDMLVKHPRLKVYMMHAGGQYHAQAIDIMEMYPQVYAEIGVLSWLPGWTEEVLVSFLRSAQKRGMLDRVMFGSDQMVWPAAIGMVVERIDGYDFLFPRRTRAFSTTTLHASSG